MASAEGSHKADEGPPKGEHLTDFSFFCWFSRDGWQHLLHARASLEHHLLPSVPKYNLALMHSLLKDKGYYDSVYFPRGYIELLRYVSFKDDETLATA